MFLFPKIGFVTHLEKKGPSAFLLLSEHILAAHWGSSGLLQAWTTSSLDYFKPEKYGSCNPEATSEEPIMVANISCASTYSPKTRVFAARRKARRARPPTNICQTRQ
jgi:hypothetical protein